MRDVGQQSLFDCQRSLVTTFDGLLMTRSKLQHSNRGLKTLTLQHGLPGSSSRPLKAQVLTSLRSTSQILNRKALVEVRGFEPLTPALQTRCSAN